MAKEEKNLYNKIYRETHKEYFREYNRNYRKKKLREYFREYRKNRRKNNEYVRLSENKRSYERLRKTSYALKHKQRWTVDEINYILRNHNSMTGQEMAIYLNRSEAAVFMCMNRLRKEHKI